MATSDFLHRAVRLSILMAVLNLTGCLPSPTATPLIESPPLTSDTPTAEPSAAPLPTATSSLFDHALAVLLPSPITQFPELTVPGADAVLGLGIFSGFDISPDESRVAFAASNGLIVLDTTSLEQIWAAPVAISLRGSTQWSPDGTRIAAFNEGTLYVWDGLSGAALQSLTLADLYPILGEESNTTFTEFAWSPDSTVLAVSIEAGVYGSPSYSWETILWDSSSGEIVQRLDSPQHGVFEFMWSTDGTRLAARLNDHDGPDETDGVIWEIPSGETVTFTEIIQETSDDLSRVVLGHSHSLNCELWDVGSYTQLAEFESCPAISPNFQWGAQATPGHVEILDLSQGPPQIAATIEVPLVTDEFVFSWSLDGSRLAASNGATVVVLDIQTRSVLTTLQDSTLGVPGESGADVTWLPDNQRIITTDWDWDRINTDIWHVETGEWLGGLEGFEIDYPYTSSLSSIDPLDAGLVLIHTSESILLWDVDAGVPIAQITGIREGTIGWSPDGAYVARQGFSYRDDKRVRENITVWDVATQQAVAVLPETDTDLFSFPQNNYDPRDHRNLTSPDGKYEVVIGRDSVKIAGLISLELLNDSNDGTAAAWSPDSRLVAVVNAGVFYLWNVETGELVAQHSERTYTNWLVFSPDGSRIAAQAEGTIVVWRIEE
jgi:Tol biopolymer transport system component